MTRKLSTALLALAGTLTAQSTTSTATSTPTATVSHIPLSTASLSPALPTFSPLPDDEEPTPQPWCDSPIYCSGDILQSVALAQLYADGKTFVDKPTKFSADEVLNGWSKVNNGDIDNATVGQIEEFVEQYFGPEGSELVEVLLQNFDEHPDFLDNIDDDLVQGFVGTIHTYWTQLVRQVNTTSTCDNDSCDTTLLPLPDTFVVPGGRFRELYYWDTYFSFLGMLRSGLSEQVKETLNNFIDAIDSYGFIPNGFRSYYLNRSQPPFFTLMVEKYVDATNDTDFLSTALPAVEKELIWWQNNRTSSVQSPWSGEWHQVARYNVSNTAPRPESYFTDYETANKDVEYTEDEQKALYAEISSAAESGWDFSSRWSKSPRASEGADDQNAVLRQLNIRQLVPVDLNSILYKVHTAAASLYDKIEDADMSDEHTQRAEDMKRAILDLFWDGGEDALVFKDFNTTSNDYSDTWSLASYFPYWAGIVPDAVAQDSNTAQDAFAGLRFVLDRYNGSLPCTLIESGLQWDAPNAWAPLQYITVKALEALPDSVAGGALRRPDEGGSTYDLVPSTQLGLDDESQAPIQPLYNVSGSASTKDDFANEYERDWRDSLANEIVQRFVSSAFCSWYSTGGSIPDFLDQLPAEKLALYDADPSFTGYMFEKYNMTNLVAAGGGGEYEVVVGFGMSNGVLIDLAADYGHSLERPNCPDIEITERKAPRRQLAPLYSGQ